MTYSESRPISANVCNIKLEGAANVTLRQGAVPSMTVRCSDPAYLNKVITSASGNVLTIAMKPIAIIQTGKVKQSFLGGLFGRGYQINIGDNSVQVGNGGSSHQHNMTIEVDMVLPNVTDIHIMGSGNVTYAQAKQTCLSAEVSGSGSIEIEGVAANFAAKISGSGDISARSLAAQNVQAKVSGSGDIEVTALKSIRARITGSGDIKVFGNPAERDTSVPGSGRIKIKKEKSEHEAWGEGGENVPRG